METLLAIGGYTTRAVHMSDGKKPPGTHAVVEVFYGAGWHLYDPTFGIKFNKDGEIASYRDVRLDTSVITPVLFQKMRPKVGRQFRELLLGIYETGYHHFYYFKDEK